jgi:hypothetical protein
MKIKQNDDYNKNSKPIAVTVDATVTDVIVPQPASASRLE